MVFLAPRNGRSQSNHCYSQQVGHLASEGIELEADPRRVELILQEVGGEAAKITTPLVKKRMEDVCESEPLSNEEAARYRSVSMRLAYLSRDRPDLLLPGKELAKGLNPTHMQMLKRRARYLRSYPRLLHLFPNQTQFTQLDVRVDADHAG